MQTEIAFIIPFFGKLPPYFNTFIKTVADKNFTILFITDAEQPVNIPINIKWIIGDFKKLKYLFEEKLGQPVLLEHPYKICDFKPAYGLVFSDYLQDYKFWGSMDIDICMGNFDAYFNEKILATFDVFSGITAYLSGSFFIIRNNDYFNTLFKKSTDWKKVFLMKNYAGFDECGGHYFEQLKAGKTFSDIKPAIESFSEVLLKENKEATRLKFTNYIIEPKKGITSVHDNSVVYNNQGYLMVHLIYYKNWYFFYTNKEVKFPFYISRMGFFQNKPRFFEILISKNILFAIQQKININLKKIQLHA